MNKDFATKAATAPDKLSGAGAGATEQEDPRPHVPVESGIGGEYEMIGSKRVLVKASTVDHPEGNCPRDANGKALVFDEMIPPDQKDQKKKGGK
ncbi:MAG TPA: hypothetical protein VF928_09230 [Usitatibacteraceae bacterium]